jgi:hypothetical protein
MTSVSTENAVPGAGAVPDKSAARDEDTFVFPDSWRKHLHPRRGGVPGPKIKLDKKAPAATDLLVATARVQWLDAAMANPANDQQIAARMRQTLEGDAAALGAAALALTALPRHDGKLSPFVDAWTVRHGIPFAAVAAVKVGAVFVSPSNRPQFSASGSGHSTSARGALLRRMRALLAESTDEEYAATIAALEDARACCENCRAAAAYLVPTETAWVAEACREYQYQHSVGDLQRKGLLHCALSTAEQVELLGDDARVTPYRPEMDTWVTMVDGLGLAAAPLLAHCLGAGMLAETARAAGSVIARIPGDEAFRLLVDRLDQPYLGAALGEASARFPARALRLLAEVAATGSTKNAEIALDLLQRQVQTHREAAETAVLEPRGLSEQSRTILEELVQQQTAKPAASAESLPMLLVSPPWTRPVEKKPQAAQKIVTGLEPPALTRVEWGEKELAALARIRVPSNPRWDYAAMAAEVTGWVEAGIFEQNGHNVAADLFSSGPVDPNRELLRRWRPDFEWNVEALLWPALRRFELDAVPALVHTARHAGPESADVLIMPVLDLEIARLAADWLVRLKTGRKPAEAWFERHGADAALLLVPDAVGKPGKARKAAEGALRHLAATTVPSVADLAKAEYGVDAAEAVLEILAVDPAELLPRVAAPALPDWLDPATLPQVLLYGGEQALPDSAVRHLLAALALSTSYKPYPGLTDTLEVLDRASVTEFCWRVFSAWRSVGHPAKQGWALSALGIVGDDETVSRLVPIIKAWPGESGHYRAVTGLDVLAAIGTDHALQRLDEIAQRVQFKALKDQAGLKIAEIAAQRGLTGEQLADRLVPDLGLDADGGLWLDYGPRRFRVGFDEQLKPFVTDQAGARRKDLPAANAKDDAESAAAARKQFTALKKEARAVSADQIRRLEAALVDQRPWTAAEFTDLLLAHPLLRHIVRRLVWVSELDETRTGFRVAEDLTLADVEDAGFVLPAAATVRLAHPLSWPDGLGAWGEIFADYEILQPFPQLGREVHALTDEEKATYRLGRFEGKAVPIGRVLGLTKSGWRRSPAMDNGIENCITKRLGTAQYLVIDLDDGIPVGALTEDWAAEQTLRAVYLSHDAEVYHQGHRDSGLRFADLDPVTASELLGQLTRLVD